MDKFNIVKHKIPCQHIREYPQATANSQEDVFHLSVKQYIPSNNPHPQPGDVTIIAAHANAFPKELFEPLWDDLLELANRQGWRIRSIWAADKANQGQSGVINEELLGNEPGWHDHSRDLLHVINLKRSDMPRPIIGVGHSMGGNQLAYLSLMHPRLLSSLVLLDAVIQEHSGEFDPDQASLKGNLAYMSTFRRNVWPSRESAAAGFQKSPFYKIWDPRVLAKWVQYGLRDTPTVLQPNNKAPEVTLTTTPSQEVFVYLRPNYESYGVNGKPINRETHADLDPTNLRAYPFYRAEARYVYFRLGELRPSTLWIFGETSVITTAARDEEKVRRTGIGIGGSGGVAEGKVKGVTLKGVGHLFPMEVPTETAETMSTWIGSEVAKFQEEMRRYEEWRVKPLLEKTQVDEKWKEMMGGPPKRFKM